MHEGPSEHGSLDDQQLAELGRHRWIVVVDSPFLPVRGGGEREAYGFVESAVSHNLIEAMVIPTDDHPARYGRDDDLAGLRDMVAPAPVIFSPRRRTLLAATHPGSPYQVRSRPTPRDLVADLRVMAPQATGVLVFSYKAHQIGEQIAKRLGLPAVIRMHNLEGRYVRAIAASATGLKGIAFHLEAMRIAADERRMESAGWVNAIADISATDAAYRAARTSTPVRYVPTFALGRRLLFSPVERVPPGVPTVIFLGALYVRTNHDALNWFAGQVWPRVLRTVNDARWLVAGRQPTPEVEELVRRTPRAELRPNVPDSAEALAQASVAINPAVSGSGVNIKLVEYLASGTPVVSTTMGMQGVGVTPQEHLLVADNPSAFASAVANLLQHGEDAARLGETGAQVARRILNVDTSLLELARLFPTPSPQSGEDKCSSMVEHDQGRGGTAED